MSAQWVCPKCGWVREAHSEYGWQKHDDRAVEVHCDLLCPANTKETNPLAGYSNDGLLKAFAVLTHRIHAARGKDETLELRLRDERELLQTEILRRMGGN